MKIPKNFGEWWEGTAEGQKAIAQAVADGVEKREMLVAEDERIEAELLKARVAPQKNITAALSKVEKATKALADAQLALQRERVVLHNLEHQARTRKTQIEHELRQGAALPVRDFLKLAGNLWDGELPKDGERRRWASIAPVRDGVKMPAQVRLDQIRTIIKRAEALLLVADPEAAESALVGLREELADPLAAVA